MMKISRQNVGFYCFSQDKLGWIFCIGRAILVLILIGYAVQGQTGFAKVSDQLKSQVLQGLVGRNVTSEVNLGNRAYQPLKGTYQTSSPSNVLLPINTLVYPDGQLVYRIEFGFVRTDVTSVQEMFAPGTSFRIEAVDMREDRIDIHLKDERGTSAQLKVMLGKEWSGYEDAASVFSLINQYLKLPANIIAKANTGSSLDSLNRPPMLNTSAASQAIVANVHYTYVHSPLVAMFPERISQANMDRVLSDFEAMDGQAITALIQKASILQSGLLGLQRNAMRYQNPTVNDRIQAIANLQRSIGPALQPKSREDVVALLTVWRGSVRGFSSMCPIPYEPTESNVKEALAAQTLQHDLIAQAANQVIKVERDLDNGEIGAAIVDYTLLSGEASLSPVNSYLRQTAALNRDLDDYAKIKSGPQVKSLKVDAELILALKDLQQSEDSSLGTLAQALLIQRLTIVKEDLKMRLGNVPILSFSKIDFSSHGSQKLDLSGDFASTKSLLERLDKILEPMSDLILIKDQIASAGPFLGDKLTSRLAVQIPTLEAALSQRDALQKRLSTDRAEIAVKEERVKSEIAAKEERVKSEEEYRNRELERQQEITNKCVSLAVQTVLLEQKFEETTIMGYQMDADKDHEELKTLSVQLANGNANQALRNTKQMFKAGYMAGMTVYQSIAVEELLNSVYAR